ncbi:hypothetical protein [Clostridium kluyveri]|uniref:Uncharacterized protein n=1 Tax=Clostridium kluyveri TaxID=1534 RepID=A0A1L5FCF0_CLOKL|nr:hypothetical protein [Clostridium kluyveri]APM40686.1 hypothetical protein BS101_19115 [Clostridium kluyveri]
MKKKRLIIIISIFVMIILICLGSFIYRSVTSISEIFRLNSKLQAEGYYMGQFEFKMLGCAYYLDKGHYITAFSKLNQIHKQLETKEGLIKVPKFTSKKEEFEFYIGLQNPKTGAFMDNSYPLFTYIGSTLNMIKHLESLSNDTGQPIKLKYPIKFLNQINSPEKLKPFLDDLSTIGFIASKLPRTPYVEIAELCYYNDFEHTNLYTFSPEWKQALLQWLYNNEDSKTGFWGPRLRSNGKLLDSGDLGSTFHIIKLFVNENGDNIHSEFPLRYNNEIITTAINKLSQPAPKDANLSELHDWNLTRYQGISLITNYLWQGISTENKNKSKEFMENIVRNKFEKYYIESKGGFSYYPGLAEATLDGTGDALSLLRIVGALSLDRQKQLWTTPANNIIDLGVYRISELKENDFTSIKKFQDINSLRLYSSEPGPDDYLSNVVDIIYPKKTSVLDIRDLLPRVTQWVSTTSQSMGNWTTKEQIIQDLSTMKISSVQILNRDSFLKQANGLLNNNGKLIVIGFDILQVPKYKITFYIK